MKKESLLQLFERVLQILKRTQILQSTITGDNVTNVLQNVSQIIEGQDNLTANAIKPIALILDKAANIANLNETARLSNFCIIIELVFPPLPEYKSVKNAKYLLETLFCWKL